LTSGTFGTVPPRGGSPPSSSFGPDGFFLTLGLRGLRTRFSGSFSALGVIVPAATGFALGWHLPAQYLVAPNQRLIFSLGPGAPAGATITTNGVFDWKPSCEQGSSEQLLHGVLLSS